MFQKKLIGGIERFLKSKRLNRVGRVKQSTSIAHDEVKILHLSRTSKLNPPSSIPISDEHMTILRAQQGDRDALSKLVDLYDQRLLYFIHRILGESDGALDILQTVWLTVHRKLRTLKSPEAFRVWLYRITHDRAVDELRKKSKRPVGIEDIEALPELNVDANIDETSFDNAELVHVSLNRLSSHHRRVLTLRFLEGMTVDEIAKVIGCKAGTVKSRLHYAKHALRCQIEEICDV